MWGFLFLGQKRSPPLEVATGGHRMLFSIAKVLGGVILTGIGVVAAAMGAGVTGDGITETFKGGSVGSSDNSSTLRKAS